MQIASTDLYEAVGVAKDRPVTKDEVVAGKQRLFDYLTSHIHIDQAGAACSPATRGLDITDKLDGFFAAAHLAFLCPHPVDTATVRYDLFFDLDPRHQGIARVAFGDDEGREQVFRADARAIVLRRDLTIWDHARDYLRLGVEHIFTGYDHIAFLFGLLVVAGAAGLRGGARKILGVVTAFTLAHSITLISSALNLLTVPSWIVEPAIALSIAYVGVENLVKPDPRHRWLLTFCFGLVHGFGFASVLKDLGLPEKGLLLSLVSFNVGVEIGQLAVVAAILPLLAAIALGKEARLRHYAVAASALAGAWGLFALLGVGSIQLAVVLFVVAPIAAACGRAWGYDRVVRVFGSAAIVAFATLWFFERVLGRSAFHGWLG